MFFTGLAKFLQLFIDAIGSVLTFLLGLLPSSPFNWVAGTQFAELLGQINYFIPISDFVAILESWLIAVALFYLYSIWARWVKAIE